MLLVALAEVVVVQANHTFGRLLSAALVSTGAVVFYWAKPEAIYPGGMLQSECLDVACVPCAHATPAQTGLADTAAVCPFRV